MARLRAANNARTKLTQAVTDTDTILAVESTSLFPQPPFRITIDAEIMEVISVDHANNTFTVERAKEGTVASAHGVGASVENRFTAESYNELVSMQEFNEHLADIATLVQYGHVQHGIITATVLAEDWEGDEAPYTNTVSTPSVLATDNPIVDVIDIDGSAQDAWGTIFRAVTSDGLITFYAVEKPDIDLQVQIKVVR